MAVTQYFLGGVNIFIGIYVAVNSIYKALIVIKSAEEKRHILKSVVIVGTKLLKLIGVGMLKKIFVAATA